MAKKTNKSETEKDIKSLNDEIIRLSEQINAVREDVEKEHLLVDSLSKIKEEIEEIKNKTSVVEDYKSYAERISKENEELKQNDGKEAQIKWPFYFSIVVGLLFFGFSGLCVWLLLFSTPSTCLKVNDSIPTLIAGVIVYFLMAVILVRFVYQSRQIFSCEGKNDKKRKI